MKFKTLKYISLFFPREEISKKLKSKNEESKLKSDDDTDNETKTKSTVLNNDIYAEDDEDDYRISTNRRKQINASKQKDSEHNKSLQLLVEGRKKKQGNGSFKLKDQF